MNKLVKGLLLGGVLTTGLMASLNSVNAKDSEGNYVVVIDAGHGGEDPGAQATTGVYESKLNYAIAKAMQSELTKYDGVKVYLTREEDGWMTNTGRAMEAAALGADFLISLHNNSGSETNTGALAYRSLNSYYSEATNDMCTLILDNLATLGLVNGGVQTRTSTSYEFEDYYTLIGEGVRAGVPSIIVEHCFLSNPTDAAFVSNPDGSLNLENLNAMGVADAKAVVSYFKLSERTATADNSQNIELEKGYSVKVNKLVEGEASWFSTSENVATVDSNGVVKAVSEGQSNIVYKMADGTEGSMVVTVKAAKTLALVGAIDPTFYDTDEAFSGFKTDEVFAKVLYSDGSVINVKPEKIGNIDFTKVGIQDIDISYQDLKGKLRVCHNTKAYVPTVTLPAEEETTTVEITTAAPQEVVTTDANTTEDSNKTTFKSFIKSFGLYILLVAIILGLGFAILVLEIKKNKKKHRRNKSRKVL